jgi:hypothetical protein
MDSMLSTLAFALLIGGQFLAAIVLNSKRNVIYTDSDETKGAKPLPSEETPNSIQDERRLAKAA